MCSQNWEHPFQKCPSEAVNEDLSVRKGLWHLVLLGREGTDPAVRGCLALLRRGARSRLAGLAPPPALSLRCDLG